MKLEVPDVTTKLIMAALALLTAVPAMAQESGGNDHDPSYIRLENLVGTWTTRGREATFSEVCAWYEGNFHVICNSENQRPDGSVGRGMSILSYVPNEGYVYSGIGSRGRYETYENGVWENDTLIFISSGIEEGIPRLSRIRMGPFSGTEVPFAVDTSSDGSTWSEADITTYVRVK